MSSSSSHSDQPPILPLPLRPTQDELKTTTQTNNKNNIQEHYPILTFRPNDLSASPSTSMHYQHHRKRHPYGDSKDDDDTNTTDPPPHPSRQRRPTIDRNRAPKAAACLFLTFFTISGLHHVHRQYKRHANSLRNPKSGNSPSSSSEAEPPFLTTDDNDRPKGSAIPPLPPNIDYNGDAIRLPPTFSSLADLTPTRHKQQDGSNKAIPLLWHIPRTGGSTLKDIFSFCLHLTVASEVGATYQTTDERDHPLEIVTDAATGAQFLNVDTTTLPGITHAAHLNLVSHPSLHVITTPYLLPATESLFTPDHRARLFTMIRHPVERAVSMYYYLAVTEPDILGNGGVTSIEEYVRSGLVENNWMTRFLVGKMGGEVVEEDLSLAKEILKEKCLVGLMKRKGESFRRFMLYFGWDLEDAAGNCVDRLLNWDWSAKNRHEVMEEGSEAWGLLREQNVFDLRLYEYAEILFEHQGQIFSAAH